MQPLIVIDAGHGRGNRKPGVFDPGAVRRNGSGAVVAREADLALAYAVALDEALRSHGLPAGRQGLRTALTRADNETSVSLQQRLELARQRRAGLLVSLHLNAAPPGAKKRARGHEVLYRSEASRSFAEAIRAGLLSHIPPHGAGLVRRSGLALLHYDPSVLIEIGFLDSDEDFALLSSDLWKVQAMEAVAEAIAGVCA